MKRNYVQLTFDSYLDDCKKTKSVNQNLDSERQNSWNFSETIKPKYEKTNKKEPLRCYPAYEPISRNEFEFSFPGVMCERESFFDYFSLKVSNI